MSSGQVPSRPILSLRNLDSTSLELQDDKSFDLYIASSMPIRKIELRCNDCKDEHQSPIQAKIQCFTSCLANFPLEALTFEIKHDLLRSLHGISRSFSAASSALSAIHATREMDGARSDPRGECRVESKDEEVWKQNIKLLLILDEISFFFVSWSKLYFRTCILHNIIEDHCSTSYLHCRSICKWIKNQRLTYSQLWDLQDLYLCSLGGHDGCLASKTYRFEIFIATSGARTPWWSLFFTLLWESWWKWQSMQTVYYQQLVLDSVGLKYVFIFLLFVCMTFHCSSFTWQHELQWLGRGSNSFRETSKAHLLPQPEMALLRAQTLESRAMSQWDVNESPEETEEIQADLVGWKMLTTF